MSGLIKVNKEKFILDNLRKLYKEAKCELTYKTDYELLLKVMLSAQTTDKRVNETTKDLFFKYDTLNKLNSLSIKELEEYLKPIGMYKQKARNFKGICEKLIEIGSVPKDYKELLKYPGVGRKTINVVLSNLYNIPSIAVDTHVERVSKRLGLAKTGDSVLDVEKKLMKKFNKEDWIYLHHSMVLFGRYNCKSIKPMCTTCPFRDICKYKNKS